MSGIQSFERLEPVFDPALFTDEGQPPALGQRGVDIGETGPDQNVAPERAEGVRSGIRKARLVEIRVEYLTLGAAGIEYRVTRANQVRARRARARRRIVRGPDGKWPARHERDDRTQPPVAQDRVHFRRALQPGQV